MIKATPHIKLWVRVEKLLLEHFDDMSDGERLYMQELLRRKIVWGTEFQQKQVAAIEMQFNKK